MGATTAIEWTDATWNPIGGCSIKSKGCTNCYAQSLAGRRLAHLPLYAGTTTPSKAGPVFNGHLTAAPDDHPVWTWPLRWRGSKQAKAEGRPSRIFVGDMSDLFHEDRPDAVIDRVFAVMALCPQHRFQLLTKRPERMLDYIGDCGRILGRQHEIRAAIVAIAGGRDALGVTEAWLRISGGPNDWRPLANVWVGVSTEDQATADERIPLLLATPAAIRFVSAEPLLGPINFKCIKVRDLGWQDVLGGWRDCADYPGREETLDWVIAGGESGPNAREHDIAWDRSIIAQCRAAGTAVFEKQLGANVTGPHANGVNVTTLRLRDKKGGDMSEWPEDLRIREFSNAT